MLCLGAVLVSIVAAVSTSMNKSQDVVIRLGAAEACNSALEGLQTLVEFGQLSVEEAVMRYETYVAKLSFVQE
jgi:hypothetical protein